MFVIELARVRIRVENRYPFVEHQCRDYFVSGEEADFSVFATEDEIREEMATGDYPAGYCESICLYRRICEKLPDYDTFLLHSSVVESDGRAYAFAAKSGVGKSTHTALWLRAFPGCRVINGDKPLYRIEEDGSVRVFGTPWNGKEGWGENISAPLAAVCFLERGSENRIRRAEQTEALTRLFHQLYLRGERDSVDRRLALTDRLIRAVPFFVLTCTISEQAAIVAREAMAGTV